MKLTRRKLAAFVSATALSAQQTPTAPPAAPDDLVQAARDRLRANAAAVAAVQLPMAAEPAFQCKA